MSETRHYHHLWPHVVISSEQFEWLRDTLASYAGVYPDSGQQRMLDTAIAQRLATLGIDQEHYLELLRKNEGQAEIQRLIELVLNHETFFFRNRPHLRALQEVLLPELHRRKPITTAIRIWSAGCASGEEAYSIAIAALEALGQPLTRTVEIIATDLSSLALRRAEQGLYRGRTIQSLEPQVIQRYFEVHDDGYRVGKALRQLVRFRQHNLLDPFLDEVQNVDAIFCQNVTIYFQDSVRRKLIERFYNCLPTGGMLFLGFSETLWNVFDRFDLRDVSGAYVYYKGSQQTNKPRAVIHRSIQDTWENREHKKPAIGAMTTTEPIPARKGRTKQFIAAQNDSDRLEAAKALINQGDTEQALAMLAEITTQTPIATKALNLAAQIYADRGDLAQASAAAIRALESDPMNDQAYLLLGIVYSRQVQWQLATQQLEKARYLRPESALISFYLANSYQEVGGYQQAYREYNSTLWKLREHPPDALIDGVAIGWLRDTCLRQIERLERKIKSR